MCLRNTHLSLPMEQNHSLIILPDDTKSDCSPDLKRNPPPIICKSLISCHMSCLLTAEPWTWLVRLLRAYSTNIYFNEGQWVQEEQGCHIEVTGSFVIFHFFPLARSDRLSSLLLLFTRAAKRAKLETEKTCYQPASWQCWGGRLYS